VTLYTVSHSETSSSQTMLSGWQDQLAHTGLFINCETYLFLAVDWLRLGGLQLQCVH